jgi:hypothetical protein
MAARSEVGSIEAAEAIYFLFLLGLVKIDIA